MSRSGTTRSDEGFCQPFQIDEVPWENFAQGERFACRTKALGAFGGAAHVGVCLEELPPGKQACPTHFHHLEEEHLYLLEGTLELTLGNATYALSSGSYVCFPAGQQAGHSIRNIGTTVARYLIIGERNPHDVIVYTDSGRVSVRLTDEGYRKSSTMTYWEGESRAE
jgi:uncharacterized cupin superfamily protein